MSLPQAFADAQSPDSDNSFVNQLAAVVRGEVRLDQHDRLLYATDASIYQMAPLAVVLPIDTDDVSRLLAWCQGKRMPVIPRGGGTSLAGQGVNRAVVCDLSPNFRAGLSVNVGARVAHVQTGMSIDQVNRWLTEQGTGLFFAPDPATVAQCAVGGAIGNNAAGARSIRYGRTSENIAALEVVLADGQKVWLGPGAGRTDPLAARLAGQIAALAREYAQVIRERFPKLNRRNAGYGIDMILQQIDAGLADIDLDLTGLICGSEGTLGIVTSAKLKLHPVPQFRGLGIISFPDVLQAVDAVQTILATGAVAVELLDEAVLDAAANNINCRPYLDLLEPIGNARPGAVLYVEYIGEQAIDEVDAGLTELVRVLAGAPLRIYRDAPSMARAWALRKAGEPLLHGIPGKRKPLTFVEDNSIPVAQLSRFVRGVKEIVGKYDVSAAYWAHASVGVLHIRPMLDLHDEADRDRLRAIAVEVADLAKDCGGVMSGEHGDGRVRGPLLERFFGPEVMDCFARIKQVFDPSGILNPNTIVNAGPIESITQRLRIWPEESPVKVVPTETYFDYSDQAGFDHAVEMCNGAGVCRKTAGGTMCPSYRATLDERHSTRGRGNALRLAMTGQLKRRADGTVDFDDPDTLATLDLCLSCKACKSECPSNVDISRLKAEYLAHRHRQVGTDLAAKVFGHVRTLNRLGSIMPGITNFVNTLPPVRMLLNRLLKLAPKRSLPRYARSLYRQLKPTTVDRPRVVIYADCFVTYNEPELGLSAARVLEKLGYSVVLPKVHCCGRAMISTGLLPDAIASADRALADLLPFARDETVMGIVVLEPSCLSAIRDDWLQLKLTAPLADRQRVAEKSFLVEDFIDTFWEKHPVTPDPQSLRSGPPILLHGHCHQKALWGDKTSSAALRRLAGDRVKVLDSGCCGMAGSFGYLARKYDLSMKIGELSVFEPVRQASADTCVTAPGTSCRHQIHDGTGRKALHPIQVIEQLLSN